MCPPPPHTPRPGVKGHSPEMQPVSPLLTSSRHERRYGGKTGWDTLCAWRELEGSEDSCTASLFETMHHEDTAALSNVQNSLILWRSLIQHLSPSLQMFCCVIRVTWMVDPGRLTLCIVMKPEPAIQDTSIPDFLFSFFQNKSMGTVTHKGSWLASPQSNMPPLSLHTATWGVWYHYTPTQWKVGERQSFPLSLCLLHANCDIHLIVMAQPRKDYPWWFW